MYGTLRVYHDSRLRDHAKGQWLFIFELWSVLQQSCPVQGVHMIKWKFSCYCNDIVLILSVVVFLNSSVITVITVADMITAIKCKCV